MGRCVVICLSTCQIGDAAYVVSSPSSAEYDELETSPSQYIVDWLGS